MTEFGCVAGLNLSWMQPSCSCSQCQHQCPPPDRNPAMSTNRQQPALSGGKFPSPVFSLVPQYLENSGQWAPSLQSHPPPCQLSPSVILTPKNLFAPVFLSPADTISPHLTLSTFFWNLYPRTAILGLTMNPCESHLFWNKTPNFHHLCSLPLPSKLNK